MRSMKLLTNLLSKSHLQDSDILLCGLAKEPVMW